MNVEEFNKQTPNMLYLALTTGYFLLVVARTKMLCYLSLRAVCLSPIQQKGEERVVEGVLEGVQ